MRRRLVATVASAALLFFGIAVPALAQGRGPGPGMPGGGPMATVSSEFDYLTHMIPHHEEAVVAARALVVGTSRPELRAFGQGIITTQTAEIQQMRQWLARWYTGRDTGVDYTPMMRDMTGLAGDALDRAFLTDMIPHHMMAVMMSHQLLNRGLVVHAPVQPFATTIARTQSAEIRRMRAWLAEWFGSAGGGTGPGGMGAGMHHATGSGGHGPHHGGGMGAGGMGPGRSGR
jgi:uncharacterized protein (DUF305 family)